MTFLQQYMRSLPHTIRDGYAGLRDMLLWGTVYPRTIDIPTLRAMRERP